MEIKYITSNFIKKHIPLGLLIMWMRKGKLNFLDLGGWAKRNISMVNIIKEALDESNINDLPLFIINTNDNPIDKYFKFNIFSFSEKDGYYDKIIPDFTYDARLECKIPEFNEFINEVQEAGKHTPTINKIGWIGNYKTSASRLILAKLGDQYPNYLDIKDSNCNKYVSLPELIKTYKYLIDVEGNGFSGRLKYLFFSGRPVFVQERNFKEYALIGATPYKDFIPIKNDFSDLIEKIEEYFDNNKINEIGKNGQLFAIKNKNKEVALKEIKKIFLNYEKIRFNSIKIIIFILCLYLNKIKIMGADFIIKNLKKINNKL